MNRKIKPIWVLVPILIAVSVLFYMRQTQPDGDIVIFYQKGRTVTIKQNGLEGTILEAKNKNHIRVRYKDLTGQLHDMVFTKEEIER